MKNSIRILVAFIGTVLLGGIFFYLTLPAINIANGEFWAFLSFLFIAFGVIYTILSFKAGLKTASYSKKPMSIFKGDTVLKVVACLAVIPMVVLIIGNIASSTFFNAQKYSEIITVEEAVFEEDMPENDLVSNIALMDTESATIIGNRTLGALSDVVSQYQISGNYSQINYSGVPQKVSNLEYADFFKWLSNKDKGIPGFVMVDPVNSGAEYITFDKPMKYVDSAYFGEDLHRKLRFSYPTKIFGSYSFEIDEQGNPYYIMSCMSPKIGLFGAMDVSEVVIFNPCDGTSELYSVDSTPSWVDIVYTGTNASQKYDWYGTLKNGYWNSVIGNKDCKVTTDDFGYIVIGDDVWYFTGVTSVTSDESNIGFIISNARTAEYKFYPVIGAEEYSAMKSAEGEVQEKEYVASFPSLINVSGEATYIMVLKDSGGLVKLYALVNVENYNVVATGQTQREAKQAYVALLKTQGIIDDSTIIPDNTEKVNVEVEDIKMVTISGESVVYLKCSDGNMYKQTVSADERVMLISVGDTIEIRYTPTDIDGICQIISWSFSNT